MTRAEGILAAGLMRELEARGYPSSLGPGPRVTIEAPVGAGLLEVGAIAFRRGFSVLVTAAGVALAPDRPAA
jgi:hypothetical protein